MIEQRANEIKKLVITDAIGAAKSRYEISLGLIENLMRHISLYENDVYKDLTIEYSLTGLTAAEPFHGELVFSLTLLNVQNGIRRVIEKMSDFAGYSIRFQKVY